MRKFSMFFLFLACLVGGCTDSDTDSVFTNTSTPAGQPTFALSVRANPAALNRAQSHFQFAPTVVQLQVTVFDSSTIQLAQQTGPRTQTFTFAGLAAGDYLVRTLGLDTNGATVGFFDRVVSVQGQSLTTVVPGLRPQANPPAAQFPTAAGTPFFVVTQGPATLTGGANFNLSGQVFDGFGNPVTSTVNNVSLTSNGLALSANPAVQNSDASGAVTFTGLSYPNAASGTTLLHLNAPGVTQGTSNLVQVTPAAGATPRLNFVTLPTNSVAGQAFAPDFQVEALDGNGQRVAQAVNITLALAPGAPAGSSLSGTVTRATTNGLATFPGMSVNQAGSYTFRATATSFDTANSPSLTVNAPPSPRLNFVTVPTTATTNQNLNPDIQVEALDGNGVRVTGPVTITLAVAPGAPAGTNLNGTLSVPATQGLATFPNLSISMAGTVGLRATAGGFQDADSTPITVTDPAPFFASLELVSRALNGDPSMDTGGLGGVVAGERNAISADGRYVAFVSTAPNLPAGSLTRHVYRYDRTNDTIELCSRDAGGTPGNGNSGSVAISANGRFVCFASSATNLVTPDLNGTSSDVFVYDADLDTITQPIRAADGGFVTPDISADGNLIVCRTNSPSVAGVPAGSTFGVANVILFERAGATPAVRVLRPGVGPHRDSINHPTISGNGRRVAVLSRGQFDTEDTDNFQDVYVFELGPGPGLPVPNLRAEVASLTPGGTSTADADCTAPELSQDGQFLLFSSFASNLVPTADNPNPPGIRDQDLYARDLMAGTTSLISFPGEFNRQGFSGVISDDNRYVGFTGSVVVGATVVSRVFVHDRNLTTNRVRLASVFSDGSTGPTNRMVAVSGVLSGDGTTVGFNSTDDLIPGTQGGTYTVNNPFLP